MQKRKEIFADSVVVKATEGEENQPHTLTVIACDPSVDRDDDIFDTASLKLPIRGGGHIVAASLNGNEDLDIPCFIDHERSVKAIIGSTSAAKLLEGDKLELTITMASNDDAIFVYNLAKEGHLGNNVSVTYAYDWQDGDREDGKFMDAELLEVSIVWRGSNKNADVVAVKSADTGVEMTDVTKTPEEVDEALTRADEALADALEAINNAKTANQTEEAKEEPTEETEAEDTESEEDKSIETKEAETEEAEEAETVSEEGAEMAETEKTLHEVAKNVQDEPGVTPETPEEQKDDKVSFTAKQFSAFVSKDKATLKELNEKAIASCVEKGYLNAGTTADGDAIVPGSELLDDVYSTLSAYSGIAGDLRVVTLTNGNSLDVSTLLTDVIMTEVGAEGDDKKVTKPEFGSKEIALREFAGIAVMTKKLVRQAAINVYDILVESFARAIAKARAEMALTDTTSGLLEISGVKTVTPAGSAPTWAEIKKMPYQVDAAAVQGSKYYFSRSVLEALDTAVDQDGRSLDVVELDGNGLSGRLKNGFQFVVEDVLTGNQAAFGAAGRYGILLRQGTVESETFDTGVVNDEDVMTTTHNLLQQNKLAHRVAFYEAVGYPIPSAFCVIK